MSNRVEINVEDLRYFIGTLQSFNSKLETDWGQLKTRWQATSESWRDVKKEQFTGAVGWDEVIHMMEGYLATSEQYSNFLKKLEQRAQDFLDS